MNDIFTAAEKDEFTILGDERVYVVKGQPLKFDIVDFDLVGKNSADRFYEVLEENGMARHALKALYYVRHYVGTQLAYVMFYAFDYVPYALSEHVDELERASVLKVTSELLFVLQEDNEVHHHNNPEDDDE
jgi:hypothetical protein